LRLFGHIASPFFTNFFALFLLSFYPFLIITIFEGLREEIEGSKESRTKGGIAMNGHYQEPAGGIGLIILLVILYIILNPTPGPIDDAAVATIGGYHALKRL
jgi:hypothetical protein